MPLCSAFYCAASLYVASLRHAFLHYASLRDNIDIISTQSQFQ